MGFHNPCTCGTRKNWRVMHRLHNHSYFEYPRGQYHASDYSTVICISKGCTGLFRTKAKYVETLKDYDKGADPK